MTRTEELPLRPDELLVRDPTDEPRLTPLCSPRREPATIA